MGLSRSRNHMVRLVGGVSTGTPRPGAGVEFLGLVADYCGSAGGMLAAEHRSKSNTGRVHPIVESGSVNFCQTGGMTLRVAIPNKGSLSEDAVQLLAEAGYRVHRHSRRLRVTDTVNDITFFFQRPKDIATYVGSGTLDVGITGRDLLINSGAAAMAILDLGFAQSLFRVAAPPNAFNALEQLRGRRVATSFPNLVGKFFADHGVEGVELVVLDGAVENAIELGVAEAIADVVETGESLRGAGLVAFGPPLMESEAILIQSTRRQLGDVHAKGVESLTNRLRGVLNSRKFAVIDYDCPRNALNEACALTPGIESPTISSLSKPDWVAVRSLVPRPDVQSIMDRLEEIGCRAILVTPLEACRL